MVGALACPKVITWGCMVSAAAKDLSYSAVVRIVLDCGQGPWTAGTEGIWKHREHLSVIDGVVVFRGQNIVPMSLRCQVLDCFHSGNQEVTSISMREKKQQLVA